jgi:hypothetical protein
VYERKCKEVYQHVYESYSGAGRSIYTPAAWRIGGLLWRTSN